jgi:hypothetical protein
VALQYTEEALLRLLFDTGYAEVPNFNSLRTLAILGFFFLLTSDCSVMNVVLIDLQFKLSKQEIKYWLPVYTKPFVLLKVINPITVYQACYNHFGDKLHVGRSLLNSHRQYY